MINRIFRCFITNNRTEINKAYITYAISHIELSTTLWNPVIEDRTYIRLKSNIEKVKKYCTRCLYDRCNIPYESYENRLTNLK